MTGAAAVCVVALKALTWPQLQGWHGLSARCPLSDVKQVLAVGDEQRRNGSITADRRQLTWLWANGGGFPDAIRVWLAGEEVVLLETQILGRPADFDALVRKLGAPAAKLDSFFGVRMDKSEWVYPDKGLTLFVNPANHIPLRVAVYRPTTLDDYRQNVRPIYRPMVKFPGDVRPPPM